jgi:large subunit ribosomal protein L10
MLKEKKKVTIDKLSEHLANNEFVVATSYQGTTAQAMAQIRWALADAGIEYHIVKNTLVRLAAENSDRLAVMQVVQGPVALAFASDPVQAARALRQQFRGKDVVGQVLGGVYGDRLLAAADVFAIADLPPREVLVAQLAAQLQAPVSRFHRAVSWPLQGLRNVLQARIESLAQ